MKPDGTIYETYFDIHDSGFLARVAFGNCFKLRRDAEVHKDEIMAKYQDLRDQGLI